MAVLQESQPDQHKEMRIELLGRFRVCVGACQIEDTAWRRRKAAAIVKLLALAPQHRLHREQLMELLWPDFDPQSAANNLRRTLHAARRILEPPASGDRSQRSPYLQGDPLDLCPVGPLWVDVHAFEAAAAAARQGQDPAAYQAALVLYTGDLLPEDRYEEWTLRRREELNSLYTSLLIELAGLHEAEGDLAPAIEALQKVVVQEPTHEDAQVRLMRLYIRSGQRYQALQQYRQLEATLASDLDTEPGPALQQIHRELVEHRFPLPSPDSLTLPPPIYRHNLPAPVTTFVGREREMGEVNRLLSRTRLLTLTGPGGCGKTRLALEVASRLEEKYPDGVWLVELAAVEDTDLVPEAVAAALGIPERPGRPLRETLCTALETKHLLLVLDNCEHLVDACAALIDALLRACPRLDLLATSRQALGIAGEQVWRVPSLELPPARARAARGRPSPDETAKSEAVRLFLNRAQLSQPGFVLTEDNAASLVELCRRLDGMPLAIELAAARLRVLSVKQIAVHLDDRFALLTGGSRAALPRQRTLRATVEWSYDLLSEAERTLFDWLSIFAGNWTLEAATEICSGSDLRTGQILDLVTSLVDQSLVLAEMEEPGTTRYRLLETLRQYAQERLAERNEAGSVSSLHADYYLALAERAEPELIGPRQVVWLDRLEREYGNLRAALSRTLAAGDVEIAAQLCGALGRFWYERSHWNEGSHWLDAVLATGRALSAPVRAKVLWWSGMLQAKQGDYARAQKELEESLDLWQSLGDRQNTAVVLNVLGSTVRYQGDFDRATVLCEQAMTIAQEVGDTWIIALSLYQLGYMAQHQGDVERAAALHEHSLALFREAGDQRRIAAELVRLASLALTSGDGERALALYREALDLAFEVREGSRIAETLEGLADVACVRGQPVRAARLCGAAEAMREAMGFPLPPVERAAHERRLDAIRSAFENAAFAEAWAEGQALLVGDWGLAIAYAREVEPVASPTSSAAKKLPDGGYVPALTSREAQVAALVGRGRTNREIAAALVIAPGTAANHVQHILAKLGFHSRKQIAAWATETGLDPES